MSYYLSYWRQSESKWISAEKFEHEEMALERADEMVRHYGRVQIAKATHIFEYITLKEFNG